MSVRFPLPRRTGCWKSARMMRECGFVFPVQMGSPALNLPSDPFRFSIVAFSGMNYIGNAVEQGIPVKTEIGAGNIQFSKISE